MTEPPIQQHVIGIAGAGTMGSGIAIVAARAGFKTVLFDVDEAAVQRASDQIGSFLIRSVERGRLTAEQREQRSAISPGPAISMSYRIARLSSKRFSRTCG